MKMLKMFAGAILLSLMATTAFALPHAKVASGYFHSVFMDGEGNVLAMGQSQNGETGPFASPFIETYQGMAPVHVGIKAKVITAGFGRSAAIRVTDGSIVIWGMNEDRMPDPNPKPIPGNFTNVKDIALTFDTLFFVDSNNDLYSYAYNNADPSKLNVSNVVEISASHNHVIILTGSGDVYTMGLNLFGQLGVGDFDARTVPTLVPNIKAKSVGAGGSHSLVVLTDGTVVTFGQNKYGKLGNGTEDNSNVPVPVQNLYNARYVIGGKNASYAVMDDGSVYAWGWHNYIGGSSYNKDATPIMILELSEAQSVSAFGDSVLTSDTYNTIRGWGGNLNGKLGDGTNTERHVPTMTLTATMAEKAETILMPMVASVDPGGSYVITGENFGTTNGTVNVNGIVMTVISWSDSVIHIENPANQLSGLLIVTTSEGLHSTGVNVTLEPDAPSGTEVPDPVVVCDKGGWGYGDKNHNHCGPKGLQNKRNKK